jgi:trehalose-phosphatase
MDRLDHWGRVLSYTPLALLLDLDGTLVPFAPTPSDSRIDAELRALLEQLTAVEGMTCMVVSGRPWTMLDAMLGEVAGLALVAEHGSWRRAAGTWSATVATDAAALDDLVAALQPIAHDGVLLERKTASLCVHHRLVRGASRAHLVAAARAIIDLWLASRPGFELLEVVEAVEVRERGVNKGLAIAWIREDVPGVRCIAVGDDTTDEDMFAVLGERDEGIVVGHPDRATAARWWLDGPAAVQAFLRQVIAARRGAELAPGLLPSAQDGLRGREA